MSISRETPEKTEDLFRKLRCELKRLKAKDLLGNLDSLNDRERKLKVKILLYLREIDRRKLYLEQGYSSMFDFCINYLKYSESTAVRRIKAERALGRSKKIIRMLLSGEMTVTGLSKIESICRPENTEAILERAAGCSCRELDILKARHCPSEPKPEKVKPVFVKTELKIKSEPSNGGKKFTANTEGASPVLEEKYRLEFMVDKETMNKIKRAKSLLSTRYPKGVKLETLFRELLDGYLEKNDPNRRESDKDIKSNNLNRTRYIPRKVKDLVYRRDGGRCSFVSKNGRRCNSTWNLQYDHIVPFGKGGDNSPENLRLLCGRHNQLMAEREYGEEHIRKFCGDNG
ncbi:MAG: HNH endonuclease [Candidatus Krumholzibacteriota bacterium]